MLRGSEVEQKTDIIVASSISTARCLTKDHEGLIPAPEQPEFYLVVDCPSLHIVSGDNIGPRRQSDTDPGFSTVDYAFCPQCQQVITRTRQITSNFPPPGYRPPGIKIGSGELPWTLRPYSPLPEVVSTQIDSSLRGGSVSTTALSRQKTGFFSRFTSSSPTAKTQKASRPAKSVASSDNQGYTLPKYLSFCFSLSGKSLILWKKDSQALVRIEVESHGSRLLDLTDMLPATYEVRAVNIRFVAEGNDWISVLINHNRQLILLVLHSSGLREESTLHFIQEQFDPRALAISPDNSFIAVGFGTRIHLFNYQGCHQQWHTILTVPDFTIPVEVKFQVVNFSSDNTTLVAATQRYDIFRSAEDDTISTYVWKCIRQPPSPQKMGSCKMPTDGQGLTSIHHSPAHSLSLILGASPTPYPLFLQLSTAPPPPIPPTISDFRIRCAFLSPPPKSHIAFMMDFKNKVFKIDLRSQSVVQIADLNIERGALMVREEPATMSVTAEGKVRVFWRQGGGLWVCVLGGEPDWRREKFNLRGVWEDAGGGGDARG